MSKEKETARPDVKLSLIGAAAMISKLESLCHTKIADEDKHMFIEAFNEGITVMQTAVTIMSI